MLERIVAGIAVFILILELVIGIILILKNGLN